MTERVVCQFSCGAASAVATKLAIAQYSQHELVVVNAYIREEDADNRRFLADCERWFGRDVLVLSDLKYGASTVEVFRRERYMVGPHGAPCSRALKRRLLDSIKRSNDIVVFGYDASEADRFDEFRENNPGMRAVAPLIERGLMKEDCKAMVERAGIELPLMYRLGYHNANCKGCVKGGEGYWRAIREDFPDAFAELARVQQDIGPGANFLRHRSGPLKGQRFSLLELPVGPAMRNEALPSCSFFCEIAEQAYVA